MIDKRWILTALVVLTLVVTGVVTGVVYTSPTLETAIGRAGIITAFAAGPIGVLMLMLQVGGVQNQVSDVQRKVNGHLQRHIGHTDDQVQELIDKRLRELGTGPSLVQRPPDLVEPVPPQEPAS
jgi:hypothetical protein